LRSLEYAVGESFVSIRRNALMSVVSISTVGLALAVLGAFALLILWLNRVADVLPEKFEIAVFLDKGTPEQEVLELRSQVAAFPHVKSAALITAEAGWREFKREMGGRLELGGIEENPLPDALRVKVDNPRYTVSTADRIRKLKGIDEVVEGRREIEQVVRFADLVKLLGGAAGIILFLVTAFIISNTIRLTVFARRREIRIMQLVGATNWFIRLPLMFEGMILGAIGGAIACTLVFAGANYATKVVTQMMPLLTQFSTDIEPLHFLGALILVGCFVGAAGSLISIRRFLKA